MSYRQRQLEALGNQARRYFKLERGSASRFHRIRWGLGRWLVMLYHEFLRDDVRVRAESLAFFMLFSILPLIAGAFLVFSLFTRFAMVQESLGIALSNFLFTIPEEHRGFVLEYIVKFKDAYIESLGAKSGTIGVFALGFIVWAGLKTYRNIDQMLNHIWSSDRVRPWYEQLRNFVVVAVGAPFVIIAGLSLPFVLRKIPATRTVLEELPFLSAMLNWVVPFLLLVLTFAMLYRFVPVRRVLWKSALKGALFTGLALQVVNAGMNAYFHFGTQTAYGKLAVVPLIAFWIYVAWIVVILGAKVSYLLQNGSDLLASADRSPSLRQIEAVLSILTELLVAYRRGQNPVSFESLRDLSGLEAHDLRELLLRFEDKGLILECAPGPTTLEGEYALARDIAPLKVGDLMYQWVEDIESQSDGAVGDAWKKSLKGWSTSFGELRFMDLATNAPK